MAVKGQASIESGSDGWGGRSRRLKNQLQLFLSAVSSVNCSLAACVVTLHVYACVVTLHVYACVVTLHVYACVVTLHVYACVVTLHVYACRAIE